MFLSDNPSASGILTADIPIITTAIATTIDKDAEGDALTTSKLLNLTSPSPSLLLVSTPIAALQQLDPKTDALSHASLDVAIITGVSANKVFQIPELADHIAVYLRPIYISQLRLVSRALYIAYRPHLRIHLHRGSTESWTSFPTLQHQSTVAVAETATASTTSTKSAEKDIDNEGENKHRLQKSDTIVTTANATTTPITETITDTVISLAVQNSVLDPPQGQQDEKCMLSIMQDEEDMEEPVPKSKAGSGYGYDKRLAYGDLVETLTTDSLDNLERLVPILRQCPNIQTLSVTRWNKELYVFEDILQLLPHLKTLTVAFYTTVDLTEFLRTLTRKSTNANSTEKTNETDGTIISNQQMKTGWNTLQSLEIKHRVPDINPVEWKALKAALDVMPSLHHLSLMGVEFTGGIDANNEAGALGMGGMLGIPQGQNAPANLAQLGNASWYTSTTDASTMPKLQQQQQGVFPNIQSLSLSICDCPAVTMQEINRVFPKLTSLELNRCRSNWFQVFEPDPSMPASPHLGPTAASATSFVSPTPNTANVSVPIGITSSTQTQTQTLIPTPPRVPFPELRHLKLTARQGYEILLFNLDLVAHRPYLTSIEIYDMSLKIETLSSLVSVCKTEGRFLKRWAHSVSGAYMSLDEVQTYLSWDEIQTNEVPSLSRVEHLYPGNISFASSLTSLHIGDEGHFRGTFSMRPSVITTWNEIIQKLPRLRILKIDQLLKGYCLFQHLGRQPEADSSSFSCDNINHRHKKVCYINNNNNSNSGICNIEETPMMAAEMERDDGEVREERGEIGCVKEKEVEQSAESFEISGDTGSNKDSWSSTFDHSSQSKSDSSSEDSSLQTTTANASILSGEFEASQVKKSEVSEALEAVEDSTIVDVTIATASNPTVSTIPTTATTVPMLETPFLEELHVGFEWDFDVSTLDLDRELIQRFRLLDKLFITSMRKPDGFATFTQNLRPGLTIVHRRHENM
ncbi:hypothetical protein FBU30_006894 [Linnemannia zychae]|nr:hypothetical protein FBU30_006894 [Linnemannia zychae]